MKAWQYQIHILWISQLISITAMEMSGPFWPLFLRQLPANDVNLEIWSALVYAAPLLLSGLVAPFWARMGDKYGHKKMVLRAFLGLALTQAALYFSTSLIEVLFWRLLQGALAGVITAVLCYANRIAPESQRSRVVGKLTAATAAGTIMGPLLGGGIIEWLNFQALFATASLVCLVVACALSLGLVKDVPVLIAASLPKKGQATSSYGKTLLLFICAIFLLQIAKAIPSSWFALYAEHQLQATPLITGVIFSAAGVGMLLSAPIWGKRFDQILPTKRPTRLALVAFVAALCYLLHLQENWLSLLCVRFVWGICLGAMLPMLQATMIQLADTSTQSGVIGRAQRAIKIGNLTGVGVGALLLNWWGFQFGFIFAASVYLIVSIVLFIAGRRLSNKKFHLVEYDNNIKAQG